MLVLAFDVESQRGREIFFIAKHHIDKWRQLAIHSNCPLLAPDRLPERFTIIEIVRHDGAVFSRDLHRCTSNGRRGFRQRTKDSARMKPTRALRTEYLFPIDLTRLQL